MHARSMELARHREEELGGSHGHLTELGVPEPFLDALAPPAERVRNIVLKSARQHSTATGQQCYQACLADSRWGRESSGLAVQLIPSLYA